MKNLKFQSKAQKIFKNYWPILLIIIVWFVFAYPYFWQGLVPYASTYQVNHFKPWSLIEKFWGPIKNNAMPDVHTQIYPWKYYTIQTLKSGQIPFWNPYSLGGTPHLANYQSAVLSPLNLLFIILPFLDAWSWLVLLQPFLAGIFTYLFVRELKVSKFGALISAIAFSYCGFLVVWMAYATLGYAILFLPLALWAIEKYWQSKRLRYLLYLTFSIPLSFFSGHFQISLYFLAGILLYLFFKPGNLKIKIVGFLTIGFGLVLSLPQIWPSIEFYQNSARSSSFQLTEVIPFEYLITVLAPDFFGNAVTRNDWFGHYAEWASFIGVWPVLFSLYALFQIKKKRAILFFAVLVLLVLILSVNSRFLPLLVFLKLPVISTSAVSRIIVLFSLASAVLAGFGFDFLEENLRCQEFKKVTVFLILAGSFFGLIWLGLIWGRWLPIDKLLVAKRNFVLPTGLFLAGAGLIGVLILVRRLKKLEILGIWGVRIFILLVVFDSLRFAKKWIPFEPKNLVYPDLAVTRAIKDNMGQGRVFGNLEAVYGVYYGIALLEGYDPLYIRRYGEFIQSAEKGEFSGAAYRSVDLANRGKFTDRVLDITGTSLIFHPKADTGRNWAYPVWEKPERLRMVYEDDQFQLFKNNQALPRAKLYYDYEVIKDERKIISRFYDEGFDFRKTLILEEEPGIDIEDERVEAGKSGGKAVIVKYFSSQAAIEVETGEPALLFLSDNFYPGWKVKVDGKETRIYRADYTFRAVAVPAGRSKVDFYYEGWHL